MRWRARSLALAGFYVAAHGLWPYAVAGQTPSPGKYVIVYGEAQAIFSAAITDVGGIPLTDLGGRRLSEISVLALANIALADVPREVSSQLRPFVHRGGGLLISGGAHSFGSGGYEAIQDLLPFVIRAPDDYVAKPFKPPVLLIPGHPAMAGGRFTTVGNFNDMNPRPDATEILRYPGGFVPNQSGGFSTYSSPLMAELRLGKGMVLGIAFDLAEVVRASPQGEEVLKTIMRYLISRSRIPPPTPSGAPGPAGSEADPGGRVAQADGPGARHGAGAALGANAPRPGRAPGRQARDRDLDP